MDTVKQDVQDDKRRRLLIKYLGGEFNETTGVISHMCIQHVITLTHVSDSTFKITVLDPGAL